MGVDLSTYDLTTLTYGDVETIFAAAGIDVSDFEESDVTSDFVFTDEDKAEIAAGAAEMGIDLAMIGIDLETISDEDLLAALESFGIDTAEYTDASNSADDFTSSEIALVEQAATDLGIDLTNVDLYSMTEDELLAFMSDNGIDYMSFIITEEDAAELK
jgi:hypothetical protein